MKIKNAIEEVFPRASVLKNRVPDHEEIREVSTYSDDDGKVVIKTWLVKVDYTRSGKAYLIKILDTRSRNSYFFTRSVQITPAQKKGIISKILALDPEDIRVDFSFKKKDEAIEFTKLQQYFEFISEEITKYSSRFIQKDTTYSSEFEQSSKDLLQVCQNINNARGGEQTKSELLIAKCSAEINKKVTFNSLLGEIAEMHEKKNSDYGDSAHKLFEKYGLKYFLIHLEEKLTRVSKEDGEFNYESPKDSLMDAASYLIMAALEISNKE